MKIMTCAQMGGPCDEKIMGESEDQMMMNGMKHLEEKHPEMAADVKAASSEDPKMVEWTAKFKKDYAEAATV